MLCSALNSDRDSSLVYHTAVLSEKMLFQHVETEVKGWMKEEREGSFWNSFIAEDNT